MPKSNDNNNSLRITPHSIEAEKAVLGCILINPDAISKSLQILDPKVFYEKRAEESNNKIN